MFFVTIMFGLNGLIHKPNAFWVPSILAFASIPVKPVSENQLNKPAMTEEEQLEALYAELAKHPNIGNSSKDAPIDPATGDYMITYEGMRKVLGGNGTGTPDGLAPYAVAAFDFYTEDIATMFGPDVTMNERMQAAAFTFIKPAKIADTGHDMVKAGEKAKDVGKGENVSGTISKIDSDLIKKYIRDIEGRTDRELPKNQIEKLKEALRKKEYQKLSPIETRKHRREFNKVKDKLIEEWEINTAQKWPTYSKDVISEKTGEPIRRKGDKFDAHHIIENSFQGEHE